MNISSLPGVGWSNPAAASHQASAEARHHPASSATPSPQATGLPDVEQSSETMDRDADGRDDRQPPSQRRASVPPEESNDNRSILELPAGDHEKDEGLDLLG